MLIFNLLLSATLLGINPTVSIALNMTEDKRSNNTDFGGLSAASTDITKANKTDLIRNATADNIRFGGLSAESAEIAEGNKTDLINGIDNNNISMDFGGLSARSVNITK